MIIGKINKNEKIKKFDLELHCTNCGKKVPGGLKTSEKFYGTDPFKKEVDLFEKNYLCGICRDKKKNSKID
ncbi:hypothetical protein [Nitrosopumilus sp.]